ncbi:ABC transporter permease [Salipiger sp. P9]|uniref:ABC transporter permease n=1 Tax=Salipiger pentaromativorans TaxID=2943193 RepID=UPI002157D625|nr:ABC transporter permease [Salipiger pentaromativorans]MCR8549741.1 ABC transporter permease [Salipiger pentaromativorans]
MSGLLRGYGRGLTLAFFAAAALWGLMLIILPQLTMLERAMTAPKRALDSSVAQMLVRDARTCISVLDTLTPAAPAPSGGLAIPSLSGPASPAPGLALPSLGGEGQAAKRPYILQCDRTTTHVSLVRSAGEPRAWLDETYGLPLRSVSDTGPIDDQKAAAEEIGALAQTLYGELKTREANANPYTLENFATLASARLIPQSDAQRAEENARLSNKLLALIGLRYEAGGQTYERIGLVTLTRTLVQAVIATALALLLCYPIAYKVALATPPQRAVWLFLGLVIPYAIVELMRIYAWTTIIDNAGLLNGLLQGLGLIAEPIQFKRFPGTVFLVIVYTYVLFMVFPIYNVMNTLDRNQIEAARDLGAAPWRVHWRIIIPHSKPGIAVGTIATFMLAAGAFSVPRIISRGLQAEWFSQTIYNKFFESPNANAGAAYSFAYTLVCFALVALFMWLMRTRLKDFARVQ